ncbi:MAG: hypothetical protein WCD57_22695, partial [Acidobacteriaceae bacterium]
KDYGAPEARYSIHPPVPRLRRSEGIGESMSQPSRAGLTFGPGPTGLFQLCNLFSAFSDMLLALSP